jgi:hypothetical protein
LARIVLLHRLLLFQLLLREVRNGGRLFGLSHGLIVVALELGVGRYRLPRRQRVSAGGKRKWNQSGEKA